MTYGPILAYSMREKKREARHVKRGSAALVTGVRKEGGKKSRPAFFCRLSIISREWQLTKTPLILLHGFYCTEQ